MVDIARQVEPAVGLRRGAAEVMQALRERTGATVSLLTQATDGAVVLDVIPGREALPVDIYSGCVMPATAAGALVLHPEAAPDRVRPARRAAIDDEHTVPGLTCYATAIMLPDGGAAALQVTSTTSHNATLLSALVLQGAARITDRVRSGTGHSVPRGPARRTRR